MESRSPQLPLFPGHFQKEEIGNLLSVIHECQPIVLENVGIIPDFLYEGCGLV